MLFGMDGFRVLDAVADPLDGELGVLVEASNPGRGCPECGVVGEVKERPVVKVRDATSAGRRVRVRWKKRRGPASSRPASGAAGLSSRCPS